MMEAERKAEINGHKIEEFYWNGRFVTYVDNRKFDCDFDTACASVGNELQ